MELNRVDQVAVVSECELAVSVRTRRAVHRLRVLPLVGAGRRVANVTYREVASERTQIVLFEDLVDEPERPLGDDVTAYVRGGDTGRLLAAMLQRV